MTPGESSFTFIGPIGQLEGKVLVPQEIDTRFIALIGHPHSLHGGTMENKVVTTLARVFGELSLISVRFNFRGVGQSEGVYDAGIGESEDMLALARQCMQERPNATLLFAGFSFGSYVAYRAAAQCQHALLLTIAPPVHHYDFKEFTPPKPWIIVHGEEDEIVPFQLVLDFVAESPENLSLLRFADTSHFFHGKLIEFKQRIQEAIREQVGQP